MNLNSIGKRKNSQENYMLPSLAGFHQRSALEGGREGGIKEMQIYLPRHKPEEVAILDSMVVNCTKKKKW